MLEDNPAEEQQRVGDDKREQVEPRAEPQPPAPEHQDSGRQEEEEKVAVAVPAAGPVGELIRVVSPSERSRMNRRELLKLVPVVAVGAFAIPKFLQLLLDEG